METIKSKSELNDGLLFFCRNQEASVNGHVTDYHLLNFSFAVIK